MFILGVASCERDSLDKARKNTKDYDVETIPGELFFQVDEKSQNLSFTAIRG